MTYRVSIEKNGRQTLAGTLRGDRPENTVFSYAPAYLAAEDAAPISLSLPLQEAAFSPAQTKNYFDSLLPEGYTRRTVAQWIHADEDDYLTILHALGCECLGALQITAEDETHGASYEPLALDQVKALAAEGASKSAELVISSHLSLAGATGKVGLYFDGKNWYLPLNKYQDWLKQWILEGHKEWRPNVYGQCKSWLEMDLQPRAMTRDLNWGIPVPIEGAEGKVLYVWFDAPIGYVSNTVELCEKEPEKWGNWEKWWQDEDTRLVHFIGKDNIVFHCIIFPVMMKAHGKYIMPDNVPSNEFLNLENDKISTSRNWAVWLHEYLEDMPGKQDVLRYVLTANAPETKDNNFTWKDFQDRNNNELVAVYGNFVNRALQLTKKYWNGVVPACGELQEVDKAALAEFKDVKQKVEALLDQFKFRDAQFEAMNLARIGNRYITECEPWKVWKTDPKRCETILNICLQLTANLAIAFEPFLPFSSKKLRDMLNLETFEWDQLGSTDLLKAGHQLGEPSLLFEKIEDDVIQKQLDKLEATKRANEAAQHKAAPIKDTVSFEDFEKLDIRVGLIKDCQRVPKSKKLLQFTIDDGSGTDRTILSGIAAFYEDPSVLVGKRILFVANFAPRKMMGIESQGMILSAVDFDESLSVVTTTKDVKPGSQVG